MIDTAKSPGFRTLRFNTLDDALAEAERLVAADRAGTLERYGNWTLGQNLSHIASFMNYPYDGYPKELGKPPAIILFLIKLRKKAFLSKALPRGFKIPKVQGGTVGVLDIPSDQALAMFRSAVERLKTAPPAVPNPVFGPLTHDEWKALHMRHAELHLGYLGIKSR